MNLEKLPQLAQDKANHAIYGCVIAVLGAAVALQTGHDPRTGAALASIAAGVAKEAWDKLSGLGDPSVGDAVATACGCLPVVYGYCLAVGLD